MPRSSLAVGPCRRLFRAPSSTAFRLGSRRRPADRRGPRRVRGPALGCVRGQRRRRSRARGPRRPARARRASPSSRSARFAARPARSRGFGESIAELARDGKLKDVRGVGDGVARRIKELLETGKIAEAEELRAKLPPGLVDLDEPARASASRPRSRSGRSARSRPSTSSRPPPRTASSAICRASDRSARRSSSSRSTAWRKRAAAPKRRPLAEAMLAAEALVERMRARARRPRVRLRREPPPSRRDRRRSRHPRRRRSRGRARDHGRVRDARPRSSRCSARATRRRASSSRAACRPISASSRRDVVGRGDAVLHRIEGPQRRDAHDRGEEEAQGQRVRRLRRERREDRRRGRGVRLRGDRPRLDAARAAREPRRDRGRRSQDTLPEARRALRRAGDLHMHTTETDGKSTLERDGRGRARCGPRRTSRSPITPRRSRSCAA